MVPRVDQALGRSIERPLPQDRIEQKFVDCAARVLPRNAIERVYSAIAGLEKVADVREVTAMLEVAPQSQQSAAKRMELAQ